jgi:hypothetical protein
MIKGAACGAFFCQAVSSVQRAVSAKGDRPPDLAMNQPVVSILLSLALQCSLIFRRREKEADTQESSLT